MQILNKINVFNSLWPPLQNLKSVRSKTLLLAYLGMIYKTIFLDWNPLDMIRLESINFDQMTENINRDCIKCLSLYIESHLMLSLVIVIMWSYFKVPFIRIH